MKSLQVLTPTKKCIFNCQFCISKGHEHNNNFVNSYEQNYELWENSFINILKKYSDLKNIVITGTNEPMQSEDCILDIIRLVRAYRNDINLEIQTRFYKKKAIYNKLDVIAYSISNVNFLDKINVSDVINRYVIILTDSFNDYRLEDIIDKIPSRVKQITFKKLHDSNGFNICLDNWIKNHKISFKTLNNLIEDINNYKGDLSIRYDADCMNADDRYMIFRRDGILYKDWDFKEGIL